MLETPEHKLRVKMQQARARFCPVMPLTELADKIGRPYDRVKYWQATGSIPVDALGALSDALGVEFDYWRV